MADVKIDYSALTQLVEEQAEQRKRRGRRKARLRKRLRAGALWLLAILIALVAPFAVLIRVSIYGYQHLGLGVASLGLGTLASAALLAVYVWWAGRSAGSDAVRRTALRGGALLALAYVAYALLYLSSSNAKTPDVRTGYARLHPIVRVAASTLILVDRDAVVTDVDRSREDYRLWGLPTNEASLHFEGTDGWVHALDLRTRDQPEWRNRAVELYFWAMGFHALRHVGTADHLHVSLRPPPSSEGT